MRFTLVLLALLYFSGCIASGQIFLADNSNKAVCQTDADCSQIEFCQEFACQSRTPPCESDSDCQGGASCSGNLCLKPGICYFNYQCPPEHQCEGFRCVANRCAFNEDCREGQFCDVPFGACRELRCDFVDTCALDECCNELSGRCVPFQICERFEQGIPIDCQAESEKCDLQDNDCDAAIDEDFTQLGQNCSVGTGVCLRVGNFVCTDDGLGVKCDVEPGPSDPEVCDGVDNNCDGDVDEGCS